ncbi:hypothetical protein NMY22_g13639 [Coprinellus aureogranulatus]|nr:hypothetical protein NMY22_g13639 [Coprinellus aureogranulatus]
MASGLSMQENSSAATLWAHLSRKDNHGRAKHSANSAPFIPPSGPQDKTATTMRVLLHDTQMNLEKFSGNVERLISGVHSVTQSIKNTGTTFEQEHDKLMGDIIDLGFVL